MYGGGVPAKKWGSSTGAPKSPKRSPGAGKKKSASSPPRTARGFAGLPKQSHEPPTAKLGTPVVLAPAEYPTCIACDKAVYPQDRQVNLDKAIYHSECAKCSECGATPPHVRWEVRLLTVLCRLSDHSEQLHD